MANRWFIRLPIVVAVCAAGCAKKIDPTPAPTTQISADRIVFPANSPKLSAFAVVPAARPAAQLRHLNARLTWNEEATVRVYTPFAGRVRTAPAKLGAVVQKNEALAEVDSPDLGQAQADGQKAAADALLAERALNRARDLFDHGAIARKDLEAAEDVHANAVAERQRAQARLAVYGAEAGGTVDGIFTLRAPLAGTIVEKNINPGQEVRTDQMLANLPQLCAPLFVISDPRTLWLQLDATETDLAALHPGQALDVHARAYPDRVFHGTVDNIGLALDPQSRTVKIRGVVDNAEGRLKAEMYVAVDILEPTTDQVEVPAKAVFMLDNRYYLFLALGPGEFERREVRIGTEQAGRIPVLAGVHDGQPVVAEGALLLNAVLNAD